MKHNFIASNFVSKTFKNMKIEKKNILDGVVGIGKNAFHVFNNAILYNCKLILNKIIDFIYFHSLDST